MPIEGIRAGRYDANVQNPNCSIPPCAPRRSHGKVGAIRPQSYPAGDASGVNRRSIASAHDITTVTPTGNVTICTAWHILRALQRQ